MSTLPQNDFTISDILPPEMPLQIFLAAAKRCDSCLYGRAQDKADGLQGSSESASEETLWSTMLEEATWNNESIDNCPLLSSLKVAPAT